MEDRKGGKSGVTEKCNRMKRDVYVIFSALVYTHRLKSGDILLEGGEKIWGCML